MISWVGLGVNDRDFGLLVQVAMHGRCLVVSQSLKTIDLGINVHLGALMRSCRHFCMDSSRSFSKTMTDVQSQGRWNSLAASGGGASANSLEVHPPLKQLLIVEDMDCGC
jgi:hypothetical protein